MFLGFEFYRVLLQKTGLEISGKRFPKILWMQSSKTMVGTLLKIAQNRCWYSCSLELSPSIWWKIWIAICSVFHAWREISATDCSQWTLFTGLNMLLLLLRDLMQIKWGFGKIKRCTTLFSQKICSRLSNISDVTFAGGKVSTLARAPFRACSQQ